MEWGTPRRDECGGDATGMLDGLSSERHRQLRRLRQGRVRREIDASADRAIIVVGAVAGVLRGNGLRYLRASGNSGKAAMEAVEMDVPE